MSDQIQKMHPSDLMIELGREWENLDDAIMNMGETLPIWEKGDGDDSYEAIELFRSMAAYVSDNPPPYDNEWAQNFLLEQAAGVLYTLINGCTLEYMIDILNPVADPTVRQHYVNFLGLLYGLCRTKTAQTTNPDTVQEILDLIDSKCQHLLPLIKA